MTRPIKWLHGGIASVGLLTGAGLLAGLVWSGPPVYPRDVTRMDLTRAEVDHPAGPSPRAADSRKRATRPPKPKPTPTDDDKTWGQTIDWKTFSSSRFGFSIRYPEGWIPAEAADAREPDRILAPPPSSTVLSIRRYPMPEGVEFLEFAEEHLRHRSQPDGCHWTAGIIFIPTRWDTLHELTIDGHQAAYRSECGFVDAVVDDDGDEFLAIALKSGTRKETGDVRWFERFVETLRLQESS